MNAVDRFTGQATNARHGSLAAMFIQLVHKEWISFGDEKAFVERLAALTDMQMIILSLISQGQFNKQIAFSCNITEATVKAHVSELLKRLGAHSRTEAAVKFAIISERMKLNRAHAINASILGDSSLMPRN